MKFLVVFLLGLSAAVGIRLRYKGDKRYTYEYEGIVAHGIPEALKNDMALKITAKVHLDYLNSASAIMRVENIAIATLEGKVLTADRIAMKVKKTTPQTDVMKHVKECLEQPVKVNFQARNVEKEITATKGEPEWCLNIKRGIVQHIYLPIADNEETYQTRDDEITMAGKCPTSTTIFKRKPYYRVERVIYLTECTDRPDIWEPSIPNLDKFLLKRPGRGTAKELPRFLRSAAYLNFDLQGNEVVGFLIREVISESEHDLTLAGDEYQAGKFVAARTYQRLTLLAKEQTIPKDAKPLKDEEKRIGLMFVYDDGYNLIKTDKAQKFIHDKVVSHINEIKDQCQSGTLQPKLARSFTRLVSVLRRCTKKTLKKIVFDCLKEQNPEVRDIILDAIARVGTVDAGELVRTLVAYGKVKDHLKRIAFGLGWVRNLEVKYINHVMEICKHANVVANPDVERTCWLSFGNLVNRVMFTIRMYPRLTQDTKLMGYVDLFAKTLLYGLTTAANNEKKITFIKAIGNAGYVRDDVFKTVLELIKDTKLPLHVRLHATWGVRHMARFKPLQIRRYLLPIFANLLMDPEFRIACYRMLIRSDPNLVTVQMIVSVLASEAARRGPRSNQVVSFIASDIRTAMNLDNVDMVRASRARLMLRFLPRSITFGMMAYSKAFNVAWDTGNKAKLEMRLHKINGPQTFIPRHLNAKVKLHRQALSADFMEVGVRMQGIHDILQPLMRPDSSREKRSLDILNYIFGHVAHEEGTKNEPFFPKKLPPRFSVYMKLFGSDVWYGKVDETDLLKILRDALFGGGTAEKGGIEFSKKGIKYKNSFTNAHLLSEKLYIMPTITGIPLKLSSKIAAVVKGNVDVAVTGEPQLITSKYDKIQAVLKVMPSVAVHMHNKAGVWLPAFEVGVIVKNEVLTAPRINTVITVTQKGYKVECPIATADQRLFEMRFKAHAIMRKEFTPGERHWEDIDLERKERGMVKIPSTCVGGERLGLAMCVDGETPDMDYVRIKRLPAFPYLLLRNLNVVFKNVGDCPKTFTAKYDITANNPQTYTGHGEIDCSGKKEMRKAIFEPTCDKKKDTCNVAWTFKTKKCPGGCKAETVLDWTTPAKIAIEHTQGKYQITSTITFKNQGKEMCMVNGWNKLPERIHKLLYFYQPQLITIFHRYFAVKRPENPEEGKCEVCIELPNKFNADIFIKTPKLKLRRINQKLPFGMPRFPTTWAEMKELYYPKYATCRVEGNNYIKTTDNVIVKERIPGTCPFVLAKDARDVKNPKWKIWLQLTEHGRHIVMIQMKGKIIRLNQDMTVMINGQKVHVDKEVKLPGILIKHLAGKLLVQAEAGFKCFFDGMETVVKVDSWWHYRIQGLCGNNDGEQWTDMMTKRHTFVPEKMTKEFIREWVVEGKNCKDPICKQHAKHVKLAQGAPAGHVCFSNGRMLQCLAKCQPQKTQTVKVAHHCLPANSPLIAKIEQGDQTIDLLNMSVDLFAPVTEHLTCHCTC